MFPVILPVVARPCWQAGIQGGRCPGPCAEDDGKFTSRLGSLGRKDPLEEGMPTHSSTLAKRIKGAKYSFALQDGTWEFSGDVVAGKGLILR